MAAKVGSSLLESVKVLFYSSSFLGIIPYSLRAFYSRTVLRVSILGNLWVLLSIVSYSVSYHLATDAYVGVGGGGQGWLGSRRFRKGRVFRNKIMCCVL